MKKYSFIIAYILLQFLFSCGNKSEPEAGKVAWDSAERVHISKEKQVQFGIQVQQAHLQHVSSSFTSNGRVTLLAQNQQEVTAKISGTVSRIFVVEGQKVSKGQALMEISSNEFITLQEDYLNARAELAYLKTDYQRQLQLKDANITAGKEFQLAESKYKTCLSKMKASESRLRYMGTDPASLKLNEETTLASSFTVRSSIDGYLLKLPINTGMNVKPESELAHLVNTDAFYADVFVYEKEINRVFEGQLVELSFTNRAIPLQKGKVVSVNKGLDPQTHTVVVHVAFINPHKHILPDMTVITRFLAEPVDRMMLPANAFLSENGHYYIYYCRASAPEYFIKTEVSWLASDNDSSAFAPLTPLPKDVLFVANGALLIDTEANKDALQED